MRDKKIKVIYFSLRGSDVREVVLSWKRILSLIFSSFVVMTLLIGSAIALFTDFYHNTQVDRLARSNRVLRSQLDEVGQNVVRLDGRMKALEQENDDLRIFADMPAIENDTRNVGVGGAVEDDNSTYALNVLPVNLGRQLDQIKLTADKLERRMHLFTEDREEIKAKLAEKKDQYKHLPSIRPVAGGRISDKFGLRLDPFTDVRKHHEGLDISAPVGTEVLSAAAGVVILAIDNYTPGKGYGKEIVIDHGDGLSTRYAHLSKILVKNGQRVDRWEVIGLVGQTGRTTGPHLHYEVLSGGKPVNPDNYILN